MVDQLEDAATSGLRAWHYRYHIGTLMHMYNCLIVLGYLNKSAIPVMEDLCNIFESNVFLGYKPRRKLWSCFQVWCGARLRPLGGMCHNKQRHNHNEFRNWALASVDDRYRGATNAARSFDIKKLSLLASLKQGLQTDSDGILLALYSESKSEKDVSSSTRLFSRPRFTNMLPRPPRKTSGKPAKYTAPKVPLPATLLL